MDWGTVTATALGSVVGVAGMGIYTHLFGTKRVTDEMCNKRHADEAAKCALCKKDTEQKMCSFNHEISAIKGLLMLIAIELKVPPEKLQGLVR